MAENPRRWWLGEAPVEGRKGFENHGEEGDELEGHVDGQDGAFRIGARGWVLETQYETPVG